MRVLLINLGYFGGGAERCSRDLFEGLGSLGIKATLWIGRPQANTPAGVEIMPFPFERHLAPLEALPSLFDWRHRGSIARLDSLKAQDFDVVHFHVLHSGCLSILAAQRLCKRMPTVWTMHDQWAPTGGLVCDLTGVMSPAEVKSLSFGIARYIPYHSYHHNFRYRLIRRFLDRHMPQPTTVVCPSGIVTDMTRRSGRFPNSRILQVRNAVAMAGLRECAMPRAEARARFAIPPDRKVVLLIAHGMTQAHKGIKLGIQVLRSLPSNSRPAVLAMGNDSGLARDLLPGFDVTTGNARDPATLASAYRAADVSLIPSLADNFPYTALESLSCSTPVVAFDLGGLTEILGNNQRGLLCPPFDRDAMRAALERILTDPVLGETLGAAGRKWVETSCNPQGFLAQMKDVYTEAIERFRQ